MELLLCKDLTRVIFLALTCAVAACTKDAVTATEPAADHQAWNLPPPPKKIVVPKLPDAPAIVGQSPKSTPAVIGPDPCKLYPKITSEPPFFLASTGIVVTRIAKSCVTQAGEHGYEEATSWMAMGIPCSGGGGRIDLKGNYYNPKMVAFVVATNCPMMPADQAAVKKIVIAATGLSEKSLLIAHNPMAVQYWEIPGLSEADVGFNVALRSASGLEGLWKRMREKGEGLAVKLYGRENAWVEGDHFYELEAELYIVERKTFKLSVTNVKKLLPTDIETVKARCELLRPRRNCLAAF